MQKDEMVQASVEPAADVGAVTVPGCQWQPIETAPKDGTWVVLFGPHYRHGVDAHIICRWDGDYWQSSDDGYGAYIQATHWLPLPPRPGDRTDSGKAQDGSLNQTSINASPKPEGE